ncbi:MAG: hypothetical protein K2L19_00685 [Eubacterium sp.]|nr:hypothetical protein [Eubacterium sp.]
MFTSELSQIYDIISSAFFILFRAIFIFAVYNNCKARKSEYLSFYIVGAIFCPLITGAVCLVYRKDIEKNKYHTKSVIAFVLAFIMLIAAIAFSYISSHNRFFDSMGKGYAHKLDVTFYDENGNTYNYDFDKSGYDLLYINGTDEALDEDLCFVDTNGILYYDKEMDIVVKDDTSCVDSKGNIYYPVGHVSFDKDGSIEYNYSLCFYDAVGNAYTYSNVPYIDEQGNKYYYSFNDLKGTYTNVITGEAFENEYCFVDENGYFVYDNAHSFVKQEESEYSYQYKDDDGTIYYWASGVTWDENGNMHDAFDKVIQ